MFMQAVHLPIMSTPRSSGEGSIASKGSSPAMPTQDRTHDVLRSDPHLLDAIFFLAA
jgi:hypothetical protein